jgi:hypothetical protein
VRVGIEVGVSAGVEVLPPDEGGEDDHDGCQHVVEGPDALEDVHGGLLCVSASG